MTYSMYRSLIKEHGFREFTKSDYDSFAGAEEIYFQDGGMMPPLMKVVEGTDYDSVHIIDASGSSFSIVDAEGQLVTL